MGIKTQCTLKIHKPFSRILAQQRAYSNNRIFSLVEVAAFCKNQSLHQHPLSSCCPLRLAPQKSDDISRISQIALNSQKFPRECKDHRISDKRGCFYFCRHRCHPSVVVVVEVKSRLLKGHGAECQRVGHRQRMILIEIR